MFSGMKQLAELISQAVDAQIWQDDGAVKLYAGFLCSLEICRFPAVMPRRH